jgi:hypothetical protein
LVGANKEKSFKFDVIDVFIFILFFFKCFYVQRNNSPSASNTKIPIRT